MKKHSLVVGWNHWRNHKRVFVNFITFKAFYLILNIIAELWYRKLEDKMGNSVSAQIFVIKI